LVQNLFVICILYNKKHAKEINNVDNYHGRPFEDILWAQGVPLNPAGLFLKKSSLTRHCIGL